MSDIITFCMKLWHRKVIFACSKKQIERFDVSLMEKRPYVVLFICDFAVETNNIIWHRNGGGKRHFFLSSLLAIEVFQSINAALDWIQSLLAVLYPEICLENFIFIHKKGWEDLVHVDSWDVVIVLLVNHINKVHSFRVEAKQADPFFEIEVFLFHLLYKSWKDILHLLLQHKQLGYFSVGILANYVF